MLFGEMATEEELNEAWNHNHGNSLQTIEMIMSRKKVNRQPLVISDPLYRQRLLEIDEITDIDTKSQKVLLYACLYANDGKNDVFVDIMQKYATTKQIKVNLMFEYKKKKMDLLKHLVNPNGANNVKCARYLLEAGIIEGNDPQVTDAYKLQWSIKMKKPSNY